MKHIPLKAVMAFILLFLLPACEKEQSPDLPGDPVNIELNSVQLELAEKCNQFSYDIFNLVVAAESESENIMISPMSISYALNMTLNGANGATRDSMLKALRQEGMTLDEINNSYMALTDKLISVDKRVVLEIANSVWVEERLEVKQAFIDALYDYFAAEGFEFNINDPGIVDRVNGWISDHTNGLIDEMLTEIPGDVVMLLINTVYFNGKWRYQFDAADTDKESFTTLYGATTMVDMMELESTFRVAFRDEATIVELPYGQGNYVMDVILPAPGADPLEMASALSPGQIDAMLSQMTEKKITLFMPRFKYRYKTELREVLTAMGMGIAFHGPADFSNISDQSLAISKVLHETYIDNKEEGTEAAAATVVMIELTSAPAEPPVVRLDRPFIYIIRETTTGTILFMGITGNPGV